MKPKCSLLISTYNWPGALVLSIQSALCQTFLPSEILIADDGSTENTIREIDGIKRHSSVPIIHIWHEDDGFRLAAIRNKAIAMSSYEYIIQIDGDIILHPHFIEDHLALAEHGYFITGSRILFDRDLTESVIKEKTIAFGPYIEGSKNFFNGLRSPLLRNYFALRYKVSGNKKYDVKGCNMSFWKKDLVSVNGYDESFSGWGREDSDIAIRLINAGVRKKYLKMGGIQYHLYHNEAVRDNLSTNDSRMNLSIVNNVRWCNNGLSQYLTKA